MKWMPSCSPEIVELADIGVAQLRDGARFALEALECSRLLGELRRKNLDGDRAIESRVDRAIHLSHAARADRRDDLVGAKFCAAGKRHVRLGDYSLGQVLGI